MRARSVSRIIVGVVAVSAACTPTDGPRPGDVLLVTIDTLRADHLSLYGYERPTSPGIERWFGDAAVFERAYSTEASTSPSIVSILSGRLPQEHGVRLFYQHVEKDVALLPDLLGPAYQSAAVVSNTVLTDEAIGMAERFEHYDDFVDQRESARRMYERNGRATTDAALRWLDASRDPSRALFLWVHFIDPHGPYRPPAAHDTRFDHDGRAPLEPERMPKYALLEGVDDALTYVDRYDEEIAFVDGEVDRLLRGVDERVGLDDTLVILTSDHGESLTERETWFGHGFQVHEELARVPLCVRGPGVEPGRMKGLVSGIDVATTVLAFAGRSAPPGLAGLDLRRGDTVPGDRAVYVEASLRDHQWRAAIRGDEKWRLRVRGAGRAIDERRRFALDRDPGETGGEPWTRTDASLALEELVRSDPDPAGVPTEYVQGVRLDAPKVAPGVTPEQLESLRALGYAE
jgi:arylsulfatase